MKRDLKLSLEPRENSSAWEGGWVDDAYGDRSGTTCFGCHLKKSFTFLSLKTGVRTPTAAGVRRVHDMFGGKFPAQRLAGRTQPINDGTAFVVFWLCWVVHLPKFRLH